MWCLILAIVLVPVFTYSAEEAQKKKLQGTWIATKAEREGAQSGGILVGTLETP